MANLIITRHGESEYNKAGIWTGLDNPELTVEGRAEAHKIAQLLGAKCIDIAFCSKLQRARETAQIILAEQKDREVPLFETTSFDEKDYGIYTGKNKIQVKAEVGEDVFLAIRRSWDFAIQDGETLKDVHARVKKAHESTIIPLLDADNNVLVVSHNNTLRAYVKELEKIAETDAHTIELGTAETRVYRYIQPTFELVERHIIGGVH